MSDLHPVYLLCGNDRTKAQTAVARMKRHFSDEAIEQYNATVTAAEDVVAGAGMLGLFADRRLLIVNAVDTWKADDVGLILDYLKQPSQDTVLLLVADKLASNSRLRKAIPKGQLVDCSGPEKPEEIARWIIKGFAAEGKEVTAQVARRMVEISGPDSLDRLSADIAKIVTYAGDEAVTAQMVEELCTPDAAEKVWALTDAWASRDKPTFLRMTEQLLEQQEHPVRLAGILGRHLSAVHRARRLLDTQSPGQVQQSLQNGGVNAWVAKKYVQQAQRIGMSQADAALSRVALLEAELKGGSALSSNKDSVAVVFERGLFELL